MFIALISLRRVEWPSVTVLADSIILHDGRIDVEVKRDDLDSLIDVLLRVKGDYLLTGKQMADRRRRK